MLLAWLIGEQHEPEVMEGIAQTARDIHDGKAVLITSVLTFTEIYESKLSEEAKRKLEDLFKNSRVLRKSGSQDGKSGQQNGNARQTFSDSAVM